MIGKTVLHYKILEKLGEGGMGVVYKAEDTKLKREVAIKFLPKHISTNDEERERFKIEAQAAAALNHPNIATIHYIEETDDETFIVMEYIDGQELKEEIRPGPLPLEKAIDIAIRIGEGLQAAHEKDTIHRDIKSSNIMLTQKGQVKIMDFGLAKVRGVAKITKEGTTLGTTTYMSPEQARGEQVDRRTDIWSLGIILYEMVSGKLPFTGDYEQAVFYSIFNEEPEPLTSLRTGVSIELERIVSKSLAKNPAERYQHIDEMLVDLKALTKEQKRSISKSEIPVEEKASKSLLNNKIAWIGAVLLIVLIMVLILFVPGKKPEINNNSIAVLPFENINEDKENDYFCAGITEDIITDLSKVKELKVIPRSDVLVFRSGEINTKKVAQMLNVAYILEGSVRKSGQQVRITAQLIEMQKGYQVWGERYDRKLEDIFEIQTEVSQKITDAMRISLTDSEREYLAHKPTKDLRAHDFYMRGREFLLNETKQNNESAIEMFERALGIDPKYSLAYVALAEAYSLKYIFYDGNPKWLGKIISANDKALELDPNLIEAQFGNGLVLYHQKRFKQACQAFQKVIDQNKNFYPAYRWAGSGYLILGDYDTAINYFKKATEIKPYSEEPWIYLQMVYRKTQDYDAAEKIGQKALEVVERRLEAYPDDVIALSRLSALYASMGNKKLALETLNKVLIYDPKDGLALYNCACTCAQIGEKAQALEFLQKAIDIGFINAIGWIKQDPDFDDIREDPKFKEIISKTSG